MTVATQSREQLLSDNAKKKGEISGTAIVRQPLLGQTPRKPSKWTSRAKAIDKIQAGRVKPSSRVSPFIRFEQTKKLHRQAVIVERMPKASTQDTVQGLQLPG